MKKEKEIKRQQKRERDKKRERKRETLLDKFPWGSFE